MEGNTAMSTISTPAENTTPTEGTSVEDASIKIEPKTPAPEPPAQEDPTDWKAQARKWEQRAKANKDAADRLHEIEESQKTEAQKQADTLAAAQRELAAEKAARAVAEAAAKTGVPVELLSGPGDDPEAFADALAKWRGESQANDSDKGSPSGVVPQLGNQPENPGPATLDAQIKVATEKQDWALVNQLNAQKLAEISASKR
jgi:hypothetical protein